MPTTEPLPAESTKKQKKHPEHPRDTTREIFETVVFVVVLVLMLKLFVAEAFVIPTGSMAPTLWGDHVRCTCRECGHKFPINASDGGKRIELKDMTEYVCENCGFKFSEWFAQRYKDEKDRLSALQYRAKFLEELDRDVSSVSSGDRVLVAKYAYHLRDPKRFDVPVFKYPVEPYSPAEMQGMNYIKRLVGTGGETIAVFSGDLYTTRDLKYEHIPAANRPQRDDDAWQFRYMYPSDSVAKEFFQSGKFAIIRKTPDEIMAVRRIVFDLDKQPKTPTGVRKVRWNIVDQDGTGWEMQPAGFKHAGDQLGWVRYQHINPWNDLSLAPYYINDFIGYNLREQRSPFENEKPGHWVSDLIIDCTATVASPDAEVSLELSKGRSRFRATFVKGECKLSRIATDASGNEATTEMGSHATKITKGGKYALRFANVDSRLTVWVDDKPLAFGDDQCNHAPPDPTRRFDPYDKNDLERPARVGARGDVTVSKVSLWRDLNYTCAWDFGTDESRKKPLEPRRAEIPACDDVQTYYVQPGHYLMFGDNSNSSADGRSWGLVPHRLMLGRAVVVYWPFSRMGVIE